MHTLVFVHVCVYAPDTCPPGVCAVQVWRTSGMCPPGVCVCVLQACSFLTCVLKGHFLWACKYVSCIHSSGVCALGMCFPGVCYTSAYACPSGVCALGMRTVLNSNARVTVHACARHVSQYLCVHQTRAPTLRAKAAVPVALEDPCGSPPSVGLLVALQAQSAEGGRRPAWCSSGLGPVEGRAQSRRPQLGKHQCALVCNSSSLLVSPRWSWPPEMQGIRLRLCWNLLTGFWVHNTVHSDP